MMVGGKNTRSVTGFMLKKMLKNYIILEKKVGNFQ